MTFPSLLPNNRTPWERAVSTVGAERYPLPTTLVSDVWNPDTCPAHLLAYLAWGLSVDVWDEAWPEIKKRAVCRDAFRLHRLKTTPAGIKEHVALTGAEVRRVIRPPASGFLYAAMTPAQRKAWLDSLPQVRIYPFYSRAIAKTRNFYSGPGGRQFCALHLTELSENWTMSPLGVLQPQVIRSPLPTRRFHRKTRGGSLTGKRATFYDRGVERDIIYEAFEGEAIERVLIGSTRKRQWYGHGHIGSGFLEASTAESNVVTIRTDENLGLSAVGRGVKVVDVLPQRVSMPRVAPKPLSFFGRFSRYPTGVTSDYIEAEPGVAIDGISTGGSVGRRFHKRSFGPMLIYDRVSIYDQTRVGARRRTRAFHGRGRFGIPDYTAELRIQVNMARPVRRSGRWHAAGYRKAASMEPLRKAIEAVRVSKAFRDTVMIDTAVHGRVKFTGALRFGDFTFGEIKEVA